MKGRKLMLLAGVALWAVGCGGDDDPTGPGGGNAAPTVTISGPASGSTYTSGQRITFSGSATDPEDGALTGAALEWSSSRDGELGTGASLEVNTLSVGTHTVTLRATDSGSRSATSTVSVTVNTVPTLPPVPGTQVLLQDDMDDENGGVATQNFDAFTSWNVTRGCVDLHGPGSINPLPGNGLYIDLDGSCGAAGRMESKQSFTLAAGTYALELVLGGNNQLGPMDTATFSVGSEFSTTISVPENAPFEIRSFTFTVGEATTGRIVMDHAGGDNQGILVDAVRLRKTG